MGFQLSTAALFLLLPAFQRLEVLAACNEHSLDFILLDGHAVSRQIEDDVKADLAMVGITVNTRLLHKADFNQAMQEGDFHLCFTDSWGPPYDPQAFATGWFRPGNEAHFPAMESLEKPMTKAKLHGMVTEVLKTENTTTRQKRWTKILQEMHNQAISIPMWSRRIPAVMNQRIEGYVHGPQQWDYPMHEVEVIGSKSVVLAPGAQTGLFITAGPMDPHSYRPNEFFISNWIYEGLVYYGQDGDIEAMLATAWTVRDTADGGQEYRFTLRANVTFHDGTPFNCAAVKMNFDHVLQPPLGTSKYHGWYHLPRYTDSWGCEGEVFVVKLSQVYYPFLQELSVIRPLRILSPQSFQNGPSSSSQTHNSCTPRWNPLKNEDGSESAVKCVGVRSSHGTGPWIFNGTTLREDGSVSEIAFVRNRHHWGPKGNIETLIVRNYNNSDLVQAALLNKTLDMVVGSGVLTPVQVREFEKKHSATFNVVLGPPLMGAIIVMNSGRAPTHDLHLRKTIMHAINKASIVDREMAGSVAVADSLFPKDAPYCNVDLTPRFDYDLEKAQLMNCPPAKKSGNSSRGLIMGLCLGSVAFVLLILAVASFFMGRRAGYNYFIDGPPRWKMGGKTPPSTIGQSA